MDKFMLDIKISKKAMAVMTFLFLVFVIAVFPGTSESSEQFIKYAMDNNYFTCEIPAIWQFERDKETDAEYKIYEIQLIGPSADNASSEIYVSYYAQDNEDFTDYNIFLVRNSKNILGETKSKRENYGPVNKVVLNGRKTFELERERMVYLHPQSKSDESIHIKEKLYVLPAKEGFYVLHYSAPKLLYDEQLSVFERVVQTFNPSEKNK